MTSIPSTTGTQNPSTPATGTTPKTLGQAEFLRLMTAQLTTQDPFNPVDNTQMVAQMAQFSQVAGIAEMNASLRTIAEGLGGSRFSDAASWIGHAMLVEADVATPMRDGSYAGELALENPAENVTVNYVDENGSVVHSQSLGEHSAGSVSFSWDGKNEAGEAVATGPLRIVVTATNANGQTINPPTATWTMIGGIQSPANGGQARLVTGLGLLSPDEAIRLA